MGRPPEDTRDARVLYAALVGQVLERDLWECWVCGNGIDPWPLNRMEAGTVDHLVPRSLGGETCLENLAAAHNACNGRRGAALPPPGMVPLVPTLPWKAQTRPLVRVERP